MSVFARFAFATFATVATVAVTSAAFACPEPAARTMAKRERAFGHVASFTGSADSVQIRFDRTSKIVVQYPTFTNSGARRYQHTFTVRTDDQVWKLYEDLQTQLDSERSASASIELEQVGRDEWRIVSWRRM
jgi:hypothetical protein